MVIQCPCDTQHYTLKSRNLPNQVQENRPMAHDIKILQKNHAYNGAPCRRIEQNLKSHFFPHIGTRSANGTSK